MEKLREALAKFLPFNNSSEISEAEDSVEDQCSFSVDYLAPEIWSLIFEKLETDYDEEDEKSINFSQGYNDRLACSRVCLRFHANLHRTKVVWLFNEIFPFLFLYLSPHQILACRQVCKAWKSGVNHFLENEQEYWRSHLDKIRRFTSGTKTCSYPAPLQTEIHPWLHSISMLTHTVSRATAIDSLLKQPTSGYKFPGNSLRLKYFDNNHDSFLGHNNFWRVQVYQLLLQSGNTIKVLSLHITLNPGLTPTDFYDLLVTILNLTPSLKRLKLGADLPSQFISPRLSCSVSNFSDKPLPSLPLLQHLEFSSGGQNPGRADECCAIPWEIQQLIVAPYLQQLKRLHISLADGRWDHAPIKCWNNGSSPQLEELKITLMSTENLESVLPRRAVNLQSVTIRICRYSQIFRGTWYASPIVAVGPDPSLEEVLQPLLRFKGSLLQLALETDTKCLVEQLEFTLFQKFSVLKYLHIKNWQLGDINILQYLPSSLEYLRLPGLMWCNYEGAYDTGFHKIKVYCRPRNHNPRHVGTLSISKDLPRSDDNDLLEGLGFIFREKLPNLCWVNVSGVCGREECGFELEGMYVYDRNCFDWEREMTLRMEQEDDNKKHKVSWCFINFLRR